MIATSEKYYWTRIDADKHGAGQRLIARRAHRVRREGHIGSAALIKSKGIFTIAKTRLQFPVYGSHREPQKNKFNGFLPEGHK